MNEERKWYHPWASEDGKWAEIIHDLRKHGYGVVEGREAVEKKIDEIATTLAPTPK